MTWHWLGVHDWRIIHAYRITGGRIVHEGNIHTGDATAILWRCTRCPRLRVQTIPGHWTAADILSRRETTTT